jgi:hypothetical protein
MLLASQKKQGSTPLYTNPLLHESGASSLLHQSGVEDFGVHTLPVRTLSDNWLDG